MNAPYYGGFAPGAELFAVDGDFTVCQPCGLPEVSFPFDGDSILSTRDIVVFDSGGYITVALGDYPNLQPWSANQFAAVLEQDFMVAQNYYRPMNLNERYNDFWANGWEGVMTPVPIGLTDLSDFILVREGRLEDMGCGIVKLRRTFAVIPPTRNELEQFTYTFPGIGSSRASFSRSVQSRLQYDYFVFDDLNILPISVFPFGPKLDAFTGLQPDGLILPAQYFYSGDPGAVAGNFFTDPPNVDPDTIPPDVYYQGFLDGSGASNGFPAELIAEASVMRRWMGNIFERRTRFVVAI